MIFRVLLFLVRMTGFGCLLVFAWEGSRLATVIMLAVLAVGVEVLTWLAFGLGPGKHQRRL